MLYLVVLAWIVSGKLSFLMNRDLLSPSKFYLVNLAVFCGGILNGYYPWEVELGVLFLVLFANLLSYLEYKANSSRALGVKQAPSVVYRMRSKAVLYVWLLSGIPLAVQLYLVVALGGFYGYVAAVKAASVDMQGLGIYFAVIRMLPPLNLCYLYLLASDDRGKLVNRSLFIVHLVLVVVVGSFSNSRSAILYPIVFAVIGWHYCFRRVRGIYLIMLLFGGIFGGAFLGVVREVYSFEKDIIVDMSARDSMFLWSGFEYGLLGMEMIVRTGVLHMYYGSTYLTVFTNFIPRFIWPGKPDTGGVIFTKEYMGDEWSGFSYATPGVMGEAMMNFGIEFGMFAGLVLLFVVGAISMSLYRKVLYDQRSGGYCINPLAIVFYIYAINYLAALIVGEFTNTSISVAIPVFYVFVLRWLLFHRVKSV